MGYSPSRASAWLGVATRRGHELGGRRCIAWLLFFAPFGSGARCACLPVDEWKPRGVVATQVALERGILHLAEKLFVSVACARKVEIEMNR